MSSTASPCLKIKINKREREAERQREVQSSTTGHNKEVEAYTFPVINPVVGES